MLSKLKPIFHSISHQGREIFVGISKRSNVLGAQMVAKAFPEYPTTIVKVNEPCVHLRDCIGMAGPEIMVIGKSEAAQMTFAVCIFKIFFNEFLDDLYIVSDKITNNNINNRTQNSNTFLIYEHKTYLNSFNILS